MAESSFSSRAADDLTAELTKAAQKSRSRCCRNQTTLERVVIWNRITCCSDLLNYASISMYDKNMFLMYQLGSIGDATNRQTIYRYIDDFSSFAMSPTMWTKNENDIRFAWNHITTSQQKNPEAQQRRKSASYDQDGCFYRACPERYCTLIIRTTIKNIY